MNEILHVLGICPCNTAHPDLIDFFSGVLERNNYN